MTFEWQDRDEGSIYSSGLYQIPNDIEAQVSL